MGVILATKTKELVSEVMYADQGNSYRGYLKQFILQQEDAYRQDEDDFRSHLGASMIGRECIREIWLNWHWATRKKFDARILRLFNRGHLEEARFIAIMYAIGCTVWQLDDQEKQFRIHGYKGHLQGSLDGVIRGIPDLPNENVLGEFKTHNEKSFQKLVAKGVKETKPEHFSQMNEYMTYYRLQWALYCAVNKNDDDLYFELVKHSPAETGRIGERVELIVNSYDPPRRINESPGWFKCKFCDQHGVCHQKAPPDRNCRTCKYATPADNAEWHCLHPNHRAVLSKELQLASCNDYTVHPNISR